VAYDAGLLRVRDVGVPVISVGNLSVGGTGKTPAALWLGERLRSLGLSPAIVTRGYRGQAAGRILRACPSAEDPADGGGGLEQVGDEAVLLAERFPGPVVCGVDRVAAARHAVLAFGADVVVLDDGFQHRRIARSFDLVLVDGGAGLGNGAVLPAGPLREPASALRRADAIVVTKVDEIPAALAEEIGRRAAGVPLLAAALEPRCLVAPEGRATVESPLAVLAGRRVVAVSGLARAESFWRLLDQLGARIVEVIEYPDHHAFSHADWQRIGHAARGADLVACTEKDLVKLRRFPFARGGLYAVRVDFAPAAADARLLVERIVERAGLVPRLRGAGGRATPGSRRPAPDAGA
jgi:tetraacyldisaccharide 4'-kinase